MIPNISACVELAYMLLPFNPPKPIWEQGVWADIFGDGNYLRSSWTTSGMSRLPLVAMPTPMQQETSAEILQKAKIPRLANSGINYESVVMHKPDQSWQEERESVLQNALKRWLVVASHFNAKTTIRIQLDCSFDEVSKLRLLADVFRGRAPATILKRVRAAEKICHYMGIGVFPPTETMVYEFFNWERSQGAPSSRLKGYMECFMFCRHMLNMPELEPVINSRRCLGSTISELPSTVKQASALTVEELRTLHGVLSKGQEWDQVFAGALLFAIYARSRWADLMHCDEVLIDRDDCGIIEFIEGHTSVHKSMRASVFRHKFLPLTAPAVGVTSEVWVDEWLQSRARLGIKMPPEHTVMPAPSHGGSPSMRPLSSTEASSWLRLLLTGSKNVSEDRKLSIHGCKVTCLSYCAKFGIDALTRLQLGYHAGGGTGLKMVHTYSRDASAEPLSRLMTVLEAIRSNRFFPDCTRSGRFSANFKVQERLQPTMPVMGREDGGAERGPLKTDVVQLESGKEESSGSSNEDASSSSSDQSSSEEFQEEQKQARIFLPPVPPPGYVFWQHSKLKTLHLAPPDFRKVFMCNRMVGSFHTQTNMSIRYDTPVCRMCLSAVKK